MNNTEAHKERRRQIAHFHRLAIAGDDGARVKRDRLMKHRGKVMAKCVVCGVTMQTYRPSHPLCQMHASNRLYMRKQLLERSVVR